MIAELLLSVLMSTPFFVSLPQGADSSLGIVTTAKSVIVADVSHPGVPRILLTKDPSREMPIASLTKLMSLMVLGEETTHLPDSIVMEISDETLSEPEAQRIPVVKRQRVTAEDLFASSVIFSANNAVRALMRAAKLEDDIVTLMNNKAKAWGMPATHFVDATGLDPNNTSTARDMLILAQTAFQHPRLKHYMGKSTYALPWSKPVTLVNTNKLLTSFLNDTKHGYRMVGSKTGFLDEAGYHLVMEVERGDIHVMVILLGSASSEARFQEAKGLAWWAFEHV